MERKKLFGNKKDTHWGYFKPAYLSEYEVPHFFEKQLKKVGEKIENDDDWWLEYIITNVEVNYEQADKDYSFSSLASNLTAEDFLEYCKDHMITSVIITT
jgi:hypothetical protein